MSAGMTNYAISPDDISRCLMDQHVLLMAAAPMVYYLLPLGSAWYLQCIRQYRRISDIRYRSLHSPRLVVIDSRRITQYKNYVSSKKPMILSVNNINRSRFAIRNARLFVRSFRRRCCLHGHDGPSRAYERI